MRQTAVGDIGALRSALQRIDEPKPRSLSWSQSGAYPRARDTRSRGPLAMRTQVDSVLRRRVKVESARDRSDTFAAGSDGARPRWDRDASSPPSRERD